MQVERSNIEKEEESLPFNMAISACLGASTGVWFAEVSYLPRINVQTTISPSVIEMKQTREKKNE